MRLKKIIKNELKGKRVLIRLDFNVPMAAGKIKEDFKIVKGLETISFLLKNKCKVVIISHLGQPKNGYDKDFSLKQISQHLSFLLSRKVEFLSYDKFNKFSDIRKKIDNDINLEKDVFVLDNIRFFDGESRNCSRLGKSLSTLADVYVNDAFAVSHRANSSVSSVRKYLPSYSGFLLERELKNMDRALRAEEPLVLIMGGAKISTKVPIIDRLYKKSSNILLGGALINSFYKAKGYNVGKSLIDDSSLKIVEKYLKSKKIVLPIDLLVLAKEGARKVRRVRKVDEVLDTDIIYDIGPETISHFSKYIKKAQTIIWNGPMGMFEDERFRRGTVMVASQVASRAKGRAYGLVGGGETVQALKMSEMESYVDWVSTGGGAMLDYLSGEKLPGIN